MLQRMQTRSVKLLSPRWGIALLLLVVAGIYSNSLLNGYTIDDPFTYADNPSISRLENMVHLFDREYFTISREASYRPVCTATYFVDRAIWGEQVFGPHLTNILIYMGTVALLFLCFRNVLRGQRVGAFAGALLFAVHPLHTEVVNNISFREDLLASLFLVLAWWLYQRGRTSGCRGWLLASALSYLCATFSKEFAIMFPALMLLMDIAGRQREGHKTPAVPSRLTYYAMLLAATAIFLVVRFVVLTYDVAGAEGAARMSPGALVVANVKIQARYLSLFLFPIDLRSYYARASYVPALDAVFFCGLGALLLLVVALLYFRRYRWFVSGWLWWGIAMAPVANVYPLFQPMAERYLFWPSVGPCLWAGWLAGRWLARSRRLATVVLLLVAVALSIAVVQRNGVWRDELTVWNTVSLRTIDDAMVEVHLATANFSVGNYRKAIRHGERALVLMDGEAGTLNPAVVHLTLGGARYMLGDMDGALAGFLEARRYLPARIDVDFATHRNLGMVYERQANLPAAAAGYAEALRVDPGHDEAWRKLAYCQLQLGNTDDARRSWDRARMLNPVLPAFDLLEREYRKSIAEP